MKKIVNSILLIAAAGVLLLSCQPMDLDKHGLGPAPDESQLAFSASPSASRSVFTTLSNASSSLFPERHTPVMLSGSNPLILLARHRPASPVPRSVTRAPLIPSCGSGSIQRRALIPS